MNLFNGVIINYYFDGKFWAFNQKDGNDFGFKAVLDYLNWAGLGSSVDKYFQLAFQVENYNIICIPKDKNMCFIGYKPNKKEKVFLEKLSGLENSLIFICNGSAAGQYAISTLI